MKRFILTITAIAIALSLSAQTQKHIEWRFTTKRTANYIENGDYNASRGKGVIKFVGKKATATFGSRKGYPAAEGTRKGDHWLVTIPVKNIKAGTAVDIFLPFIAEPNKEHHPFALEYLDGKVWKSASTANKKGVNCYSTTSSKLPRYLWNTIRLEKEINDGLLKVRLRQCDKSTTKCVLYGGSNGCAPKITILNERIPSDTTRVLFIGNSYTYYNLYPMQLKEIAWNEGHYIDCTTYLHGGYTIKQHLADRVSRETIEQGGYDYAFLQDQSLHSLRIGTVADQSVVAYMRQIADKIKLNSPNAKSIIELTWGRKNGNDATNHKKLKDLVTAHPEYFTSYEAMQKVITSKTTAMAQELGLGLSPVGIAWEIVRRERPDIELYVKDCYHPSEAGSYLSAAVGYLVLFREPFKADTPVRLKPEVAKYLRSVAERVVLGN